MRILQVVVVVQVTYGRGHHRELGSNDRCLNFPVLELHGLDTKQIRALHVVVQVTYGRGHHRNSVHTIDYSAIYRQLNTDPPLLVPITSNSGGDVE